MKVTKEIKALFDKHDLSQIKMGVKVEREHNKGATDVVKSDVDILKITLAHLEEDPKYYTHLNAMEKKHKVKTESVIYELERMQTLAGTLNETTLSRVYSHFKNKDIPVAIITAFRDDRTRSQNISLNKQISSDAKSSGYGYVYLDGAWQDPETKEESKEDSILVIGNKGDNGKLKGLVKKWVKKYNQDAALWKEENSTDVTLLYKGGKTEKLGPFSPKTAAHGYSKLRGRGNRVFTFENAHIEKNWLGKMLYSKLNG